MHCGNVKCLTIMLHCALSILKWLDLTSSQAVDTDEQSAFFKLAELQLQFQTEKSSRNTRHVVLENESISICIVAKSKKGYHELENRSQRRRNKSLCDFTKLLRMNPVHVLDYSTSESSFERGELRSFLSDISSPIRKRIARCGFPEPLKPLQSVSLLLTRSYTERVADFFRKFF